MRQRSASSISRLGAAGWLGVMLLAVGQWSAEGMSQGGPQFGAPGMAPPPGAPAALGEPMGQGMPTSARMRAEMMRAAAAPAPPMPVTRESTVVKISMAAKYGDEEDADLRRYEATFDGRYIVKNKKDEKVTVQVFFPYPDSADTLPDASVWVDGKEPSGVFYTQRGVNWEVPFGPGERREIAVKYRAFGTEDFIYMLDHGERIKVLEVSLTVSGTERKPDLPSRVCLAPSAPLTRTAEGWAVEWRYTNLVTARNLGVAIPPRLLRRNVLQRLPRLIPAGVATLVLFGLVLLAGSYAGGRRFGFGQYLLIALALAVFYPLLLSLALYLRVTQAFVIAFAAVSLLVLDNLRRSHGLRFALGYGGFGLVVLLALLSAAALATKGAGLLVTVALLVLVGFAMYTGPRIARTLPKRPPRPARRGERGAAEAEGAEPPEGEAGRTEEGPPPAALTSVPAPAAAAAPGCHCAFCGAALAQDFRYCPRCGQEAHVAQACAHCGTQICLRCGSAFRHCPGCGAPWTHPPEPTAGG